MKISNLFGAFILESVFSFSGFFNTVKPSDSISQFIVYSMLTITVLYGVFLLLYFIIKTNQRTKTIIRLLSEQSEQGVALQANIKNQIRELKDKVIKNNWFQFEQYLISNPTKTKIYTTLDSKYFFNSQTIYPWLSNNRFIVSVPSILVAIGVLGTFVGLVIGLKGLDIDTNDTAVLKTGINQLIGSASIAFTTSVWGVFLSLLAGVFERVLERKAHTSVGKLNLQLTQMFPMISNEQSLLHIEDYSEQSTSALQTLHEKIGSELQKSVTNIGEQMQSALTSSLNSIMKPAIDSLVNNTHQQSSQVLEGLMSEFLGGMRQAGQAQTQEMNGAAKAVQDSMQQIGEQLHQIFERLNNQQDQFLAKSTEQQNQQYKEQRILQEHLVAMLQEQQVKQKDWVAENQQQARETQQQHQKLINNVSAQQQDLIQQLTVQQQEILQQAETREKARQEQVSTTIQKLGKEQAGLLAELAGLSRTSAEQNRLLVEHHKQLSTHLEQAIKGMESSSQNLESTSQQLGLLSSNTRTATTELARALELLTTELAKTSEENSQLAGHLTQQSQQLKNLQENLLGTASELRVAAESASQCFSQLEEQQKSFLIGLRKEFGDTLETFIDQVQGLEKQTEEWLRKYSSEVNSQTVERMQVWNEQTISFAQEMKSAVSMISDLVDDIEQKVETHA